MRPLAIILVVLALLSPVPAFGQAVYKGRNYSAPVCNNPNCAMCNYIRAQLAKPLPSSAYNPAGPEDYYPGFPFTHEVVPAVSVEVEYEMVEVPVVTRERRCDGITCWYENVTIYRTERRPIRNAIKAARDVIDAATPRIDMLRVTDLAPTPMDAVMAMLVVANPKPYEVVYDLGCGDGRVLALAASGFNCRAVGVELNPESYRLAQERINSQKLNDYVRIYQGDLLEYTYEQADVVTVYLYPELIARIIPKLRKGTRLVSYIHPIPGGTLIVAGGHEFYLLTIE